MGSLVQGRTIIAQTENAVRRSLNLLGLAVVHEDVQNVVAFLDADGKLVELLFVYKEGSKRIFQEPIDLARNLVDLDFTASELKTAGRLPSQSFTNIGLTYAVTLTRGSSALGAFVRVGAEKAPAAPSLKLDPREFGLLSLDRSFERNRIGLAPEADPAKKLQITKPEALAKIRLVVTDPWPAAVIVERKGETSLVESMTFRWSADRNLNLVALSKLVLPLWSAFGPARIESIESTTQGHLAFVWENENTRLTLRLPYEPSEAPRLEVTDRRGDAGIKDRLKVTANNDMKDRDARWEAENWLKHVDRTLPGAGVEQIQFGQSKAEVEKILKGFPESRMAPMDDGGLNLIFYSNPAAGVTFWPRRYSSASIRRKKSPRCVSATRMARRRRRRIGRLCSTT